MGTATAIGLAALASLTALTASAASPSTPTAGCGHAEVVLAAGRALCTYRDDSDLRSGGSGGSLSRRAIPCHGDGTSGDRISFYYGYLAGHPNRVSSVRARLVTAIEQANEIVYRSARGTGGSRYLCVVTDGRCRPLIATIRLPGNAAHDFSKTVDAAHEIFHMLGAVQASAPHSDGTGHCTADVVGGEAPRCQGA